MCEKNEETGKEEMCPKCVAELKLKCLDLSLRINTIFDSKTTYNEVTSLADEIFTWAVPAE